MTFIQVILFILKGFYASHRDALSKLLRQQGFAVLCIDEYAYLRRRIKGKD